MSAPQNRRQFLSRIAATGAAASLASAAPPERTAKPMDKVRIGFVGVGGRGTGDLRNLLKCEGVEVKAICDIREANVVRAQKLVTEAGQPQPEPYSRGEHDYKRLCDRSDLDLVFTATPWSGTHPSASRP